MTHGDNFVVTAPHTQAKYYCKEQRKVRIARSSVGSVSVKGDKVVAVSSRIRNEASAG